MKRTLIALILVLFATSGLACGGEAGISTDAHVLVHLKGIGSRCPKIYAFGPFTSVQDAVEYRKLVEDPLREGADSWNVVRLQSPVTLEE